MHPRRAVLIANGDLPDPAYARSLIRPDDMIVVANGGTRLAWQMQLVPDLLVGDSDSLPLDLQRWLDEYQVVRHDYPPDKDFTDLELAVQHTISLGYRSLLFFGMTGKACSLHCSIRRTSPNHQVELILS